MIFFMCVCVFRGQKKNSVLAVLSVFKKVRTGRHKNIYRLITDRVYFQVWKIIFFLHIKKTQYIFTASGPLNKFSNAPQQSKKS